jgi:hypothetical protein
MMLASDAARAVLIAAVPILGLLGALPLSVVVGIAFLVGGFFPAYSSSQRLVLAQLASDDELRLTRAGGLLNSVNETASFIGPALGGVLVVVIGAGGVLALDAASYACAFLLVAVLVPAAGAPSDPAPTDSGIIEGLRYLFGHRALRRQMIGIALIEVGWTAMTATLRVIALHNGGAAGCRCAARLLRRRLRDRGPGLQPGSHRGQPDRRLGRGRDRGHHRPAAATGSGLGGYDDRGG